MDRKLIIIVVVVLGIVAVAACTRFSCGGSVRADEIPTPTVVVQPVNPTTAPTIVKFEGDVWSPGNVYKLIAGLIPSLIAGWALWETVKGRIETARNKAAQEEQEKRLNRQGATLNDVQQKMNVPPPPPGGV